MASTSKSKIQPTFVTLRSMAVFGWVGKVTKEGEGREIARRSSVFAASPLSSCSRQNRHATQAIDICEMLAEYDNIMVERILPKGLKRSVTVAK